MPEIKTYIGAKLLRAFPRENLTDGRPGYVVIYPDGYESWSPKETFETCYREITAEEKALARQ
jgi:hypothetical protein